MRPSVMVAVSVVAGTLLVGASPAVANPVWSVVSSPNPSAAAGAALKSVSCPSTKSCFAVGLFVPNGSMESKRLIEHWNGSGWSVMPSPEPAGSMFSTLRSVACPATKSCFAVGSYAAGGSSLTLVEHWNGSTWSIMSTPSPSLENPALVSVSCASTTSCIAVGAGDSMVSQSAPLAEHWNGASWSVVNTPAAGGTYSVLYQVACASPTSCFATGYHQDPKGDRLLAEHWNGGSWAIMKAADPSDSTGTYSSSLVCPSVQSCFLVGSYNSGVVQKRLIEHWNGTNWSLMANPIRSGATDAVFASVSCPSLKSCFAVGEYLYNVNLTLVEHWNGHSWGMMPSPNLSTVSNSLDGVACPALTSCFAVGNYLVALAAKTLVERYA